ncbi:MAG TPA: hypothetical protein VE130_11500 [Nitrososphaeraceae archaeon]|nr:hypothetical protein [Nitrososphaeraceae archaeon]
MPETVMKNGMISQLTVWIQLGHVHGYYMIQDVLAMDLDGRAKDVSIHPLQN